MPKFLIIVTYVLLYFVTYIFIKLKIKLVSKKK